MGKHHEQREEPKDCVDHRDHVCNRQQFNH
jgi:hypothetical protein